MSNSRSSKRKIVKYRVLLAKLLSKDKLLERVGKILEGTGKKDAPAKD